MTRLRRKAFYLKYPSYDDWWFEFEKICAANLLSFLADSTAKDFYFSYWDDDCIEPQDALDDEIDAIGDG